MTQKRSLSNWLKGYLEYTSGTESAKIFHQWVGLSMISCALRKKIHLSLGRLKIYPNMYVVLVAEPGRARKSQAIDFGLPFIRKIEEITVSADAITREALLQDLELCAFDSRMPDDSLFRHSSLNIISKEFESFLGQRSDNTRMLVLLTDLFDCSEIPWRYRTKHSGTNTVSSVYLNLLGATTPASLASSLPSSAIGGGLTSRILFVWADEKEKKVAIPVETLEALQLKRELDKDFFAISQMAGTYIFSNSARDYWIDWYETYEDLDTSRLCTDPSFNGWYSRKPMYILKVAMLCAAAESNSLDLLPAHLTQAIKYIESIEYNMGNAFKAVGRSLVTAEVDLVMNTIRENKEISEHQLMQDVWRDLDAAKFDNVIQTVIRTGRVKREFQTTGPKRGTWYVYLSD